MTASTSGGVPLRAMGDSNRWPAIAGILFVPLFVVAMLMHAPGVPDTDEPIAEWAKWVNDGGNQALALISAYLFVLAAVAFVAFSLGVGRRIRNAGSDSTVAAGAVVGLSVLGSVLLIVGGMALNAGPISYLFDDNLPDPTDVVVFTQSMSIGYGSILVGAAISFAAAIAIASTALRNAMPRWFTIAGFVAAIVLLASVIFIPIVVLPLWVLGASILMLRRTRVPA
ncbi:MAG TPA: hypothetical protein VGQ20_18310 [Acidimicrobiales bacterium]|nr:hypothetical protein [Acidimicrobiales bacterium]